MLSRNGALKYALVQQIPPNAMMTSHHFMRFNVLFSVSPQNSMSDSDRRFAHKAAIPSASHRRDAAALAIFLLAITCNLLVVGSGRALTENFPSHGGRQQDPVPTAYGPATSLFSFLNARRVRQQNSQSPTNRCWRAVARAMM